MKLLQFIPIKLTLFLIIGILIGDYFSLSLTNQFYLLLLCLTFLSVTFRFISKNNPLYFGYFLGITTIVLGIFLATKAKPGSSNSHYTKIDTPNKNTWVIRIQQKLKPSAFSQNYIGEVQRLDEHQATGKILLTSQLSQEIQPLEIDDELLIVNEYATITPPLNPNQFNYKHYLQRKGILDKIALTTTNHLKLETKNKTLNGIAHVIRIDLREKLITAKFGKEELGIIQALLLGNREDLTTEVYDDYKDAGAVHILAVSGLHIGILLLLLQFLLKPVTLLPFGKILKLILLLFLLWSYAFIAGLSPSIVRAVTMFSFIAYAMHLNRPQNTYNILALSIFFILLVYNPLLIFDVGFQMSYAAVFAIVWIYPLLQKAWHPKNWLLSRVWRLLAVSIAAQLGVLPLSLYYFHQFPSLFFISNLVIVPFLGLILGLGFLILALLSVDYTPEFLLGLYEGLIRLMNSVIKWVAEQEAFIFRSINLDGIQLLLAYFLIGSIVVFFTKPNFKKALIPLCCILALQIWFLKKDNQHLNTKMLTVNHQTKNTILTYRDGKILTIHVKDSTASLRLFQNYKTINRITKTMFLPLKNSYSLNSKTILIIDSLGIYPAHSERPDVLLLRDSPKVNMNRLLDSLQPKFVIADGSNYKSYIKKWAQSCEKRKLPFHDTSKKGALVIE